MRFYRYFVMLFSQLILLIDFEVDFSYEFYMYLMVLFIQLILLIEAVFMRFRYIGYILIFNVVLGIMLLLRIVEFFSNFFVNIKNFFIGLKGGLNRI